MTALAKAYLAEINAATPPVEMDGTRMDVQFNPTTLRVQLSNRTAGGPQAGAQARQRPGTSDMQVSFDLVFDTADEGDTTGTGTTEVSVLDKTRSVERFVRPRGAGAAAASAPRVVFGWGTFLVQGTMESASIDIDLFSATGVPLRAKMSVNIKCQDPSLVYTPTPTQPVTGRTSAAPGAAARPGTGTSLAPGAPGTQGSGSAPDKLVQALPGESLPQLAARNGLQPSLWRALANGIGNPHKLALGQEVPLPPNANGANGASASASAGGTAAQGRDPGQATAGLSLVAQAASTGAAADPVRQGQALVQRGGLSGAIQQIKAQTHQQAAGISLGAFGLAGHPPTADAAGRPWGQGVPLRPQFGASQASTRRNLASSPPLAGERLLRRKSCGCGGSGGGGGSGSCGCKK